MKLEIKNLDNKKVGDTTLPDNVFGVEVRGDILARMVQYQLAKRQAGTHKARTISEISGTTKKPFRQKGTGNARQGSLRSPHMRGGACIFGPQVRSHAIDLPKKVRKLALKTALSAKAKDGNIIILDDLKFASAKTKELDAKLAAMGIETALIIGGTVLDIDFCKAANNLVGIDVLPQQGINVYDILRREKLILTVEALKTLEERLK